MLVSALVSPGVHGNFQHRGTELTETHREIRAVRNLEAFARRPSAGAWLTGRSADESLLLDLPRLSSVDLPVSRRAKRGANAAPSVRLCVRCDSVFIFVSAPSASSVSSSEQQIPQQRPGRASIQGMVTGDGGRGVAGAEVVLKSG